MDEVLFALAHLFVGFVLGCLPVMVLSYLRQKKAKELMK